MTTFQAVLFSLALAGLTGGLIYMASREAEMEGRVTLQTAQDQKMRDALCQIQRLAATSNDVVDGVIGKLASSALTLQPPCKVPQTGKETP